MFRTYLLFLRIIRWPNLLVIFLTQLLFQYCIIHPLLSHINISPQLRVTDFLMIAGVYQLIAAAGYIINDYFDLAIDEINKPDKVYIGRGISKEGALAVYLVMNLLALILSVIVSFKLGNISLIICIFLSEIFLFCYSAFFKKKFLIGNVIVAVVTASAITVLILAEPSMTFMQYSMVIPSEFRFIITVTLIYTCFAIVISFARELIKDLEDVKGDRTYGGRTIPIVLGRKAAHSVVTCSLLGVVGGLVFIQPVLWQRNVPGSRVLSVYSILLIMVPLLWIIRKIFNTNAAEEYHRLSSYIKGVMLTGILSMIFIQYLLK